MIIVHHLGQLSQDSRNLSKCQIARGKSPFESIRALDVNSSNESCTIKRRSSGSMVTQHYQQWHLPTPWEHGYSQKIPRVNKEPLGWLDLEKIRASPWTKRVREKIRDENEKICTPGKSKTWKGGLGKNGYPGGLKTRKGGPGKN